MTPRSFTKYLAIKWAKVSSCTLRKIRNYSDFQLNSVKLKGIYCFLGILLFAIYYFKFANETIKTEKVFH